MVVLCYVVFLVCCVVVCCAFLCDVCGVVVLRRFCHLLCFVLRLHCAVCCVVLSCVGVGVGVVVVSCCFVSYCIVVDV